MTNSNASPPPLPELTTTPTSHPGCCLALSGPLVAHLASVLPPSPTLTLSIGSGFGLLEAHLLRPPHSLRVVGVEVAPSPNKYLPAAHHRTVHGTRFLVEQKAECLLFVYPRRVGLVQEYLRGCAAVEKVVWCGPRADWEEYEGCFRKEAWQVDVNGADELGGRACEVVAVARRVT